MTYSCNRCPFRGHCRYWNKHYKHNNWCFITDWENTKTNYRPDFPDIELPGPPPKPQIMIELKPGIFCQGFDTETIKNNYFRNLLHNIIVYEGKTSDIPEEILNNCLEFDVWDQTVVSKDYLNDDWFQNWAEDLPNYTDDINKSSIQSALIKDGKIYEFVIIWRK